MMQREGGKEMRKKINALLDKIASEDALKRIYQFIKYIYIYAQK